MRGASFHMEPVLAARASVAHNLRLWTDKHPEPNYLLPEEHRLGHWSVVAGDVEAVYLAKWKLATGKARSMREFSPLWSGVLNLDHPTDDPAADRERYTDQVQRFGAAYERITGHRVISAEIHLDEGRVGDDGRPKYNAHAHITVDRTDERGRPIRVKPDQLRQVQDQAAEITGLARGVPASETKRDHVPHGAWRGLARQGIPLSREDQARDEALTARAIEANYEAGFDDGLSNVERARQQGREAGLAEGRAEGRAAAEQAVQEARQQGLDAGLVQGRAEAQAAASQAIQAAKKQGYEAGLTAGRSEAAADMAPYMDQIARQAADSVRPVAEMYGELRALLKTSGTATQADYMEARRHKDNEPWLIEQIDRLTKESEKKEKQLQAKTTQLQQRDQTLARVVTAAGAIAIHYRMDEPEPIVALVTDRQTIIQQLEARNTVLEQTNTKLQDDHNGMNAIRSLLNQPNLAANAVVVWFKTFMNKYLEQQQKQENQKKDKKQRSNDQDQGM